MATYEIYTLLQLQDMSSHLDDECVLMNDIDASDTEDWNPSGGEFLGFQPIGDSVTPFTGSFNGGNFTISGLYINRTTVGTYQGLFGAIRGPVSYDKVTNGGFTGSATGWTLGTGWAYGTNYVVASNAAGSGTLSQDCSVVVGETYILTYTISSYTAGTVTPSCGGVTLTARSANGTNIAEQFTATTTDILSFAKTDNGAFRIDNVSLIRVITHKDVTLKDVNINGYNAAGYSCLVYNPTNATGVFSNIKVTGTITSILDTGGCFMTISNGTFSDCSFDGYIELTSAGSGIDAGGFCVNASGLFTDCQTDGILALTGNFTGTAAVSRVAGGFIAYISTSTAAVFTGCKSNMSILCTSQSSSTATWTGLGGFVGYDQNGLGTFTLCGATGDITFTGNVGSTIGGFGGSNIQGCSKCYSTGNIYSPNVASGTHRVGGFAGTSTTLTDCYSWGDVCKTGILLTGATYNLGGLTGFSSGAITDCYSTGYVNPDAAISGGFIGTRSSGAVTTCYWDTESSGKSNAVGSGLSTGITGKTTAEMILAATYTGFDFTSTWVEGTAVTAEVTGSNITLWLSKSGDYDNFEAGVNDDDSFSFTVPTQDEIRWLGALESLLLGTAGGEFKIGSNKLDTPLTPTNFTIKQQSEYGSNQIQPVKINSSLLFVDYVSRKVREMTFVDPKYQSPDLTALAEHITKSGITSVARQKNPDSILWFTLGDGSLISMTYEREQNVLAWAKHPVGGDPFVQWVCVIPGATEDIIYLSCYRNLSGDTVYYDDEAVTYEGETVTAGIGEVVYLEKIAPRLYDDIEDAYFVDSGLTITNSPASAILAGLDHINGETVKILGDGVMMDDAVVEDGQVTCKLDGVDTAVTTAQVGLASIYKAQPMRVVLDGSSMGSITRINKMVLSFVNTLGAKYGISDSELFGIDFSDIRWTNNTLITGLFTGEVVVEMPGNFDPLNPMVISGSDPLPCTLRCIIPEIDATGR